MNNVIYPDGSKELITDELLEKGSDLQRKNIPLPYLRLVVSKPREYKGTMGVTSVLNGHRYNYLKYKVRPDFDLNGSAFMALGISSHNVMDSNVADKDESEEWLLDGNVKGRSDLLEVNEGMNILSDYKVSGSYKVASSIGIVEGPKVPVFDQFGNPVLYQRNGKGYNKGDQKMEKSYIVDPAKGECWEYSMQLNKYRIMYQKQGVRIDKLQIFFIVRDGGTIASKSRGVDKNIYLLEIPFLPDEEVEQFYNTRTKQFYEIMSQTKEIEGTPEEVVAQTVAKGVSIPLCNARENWDGRRCENYCSYSFACKLFNDNPYLGKGGNDDVHSNGFGS